MLICCLKHNVDSSVPDEVGGVVVKSTLGLRIAVCCGRLQGLLLCQKQQTVT